MKIIFDSSNDSSKMHLRMIANIGCDKCPICGETNPFYLKDDNGCKIPKGIYCRLLPIRWTKGFIRKYHYAKDTYQCLTCGSEWESEQYEWNNIYNLLPFYNRHAKRDIVFLAGHYDKYPHGIIEKVLPNNMYLVKWTNKDGIENIDVVDGIDLI